MKGVVVVPASTCWSGPWLGVTRAPSLQRVANRPIVCHVLDALADAGASQVAIAMPADVAEEVTQCVQDEGPAEVEVSYLLDDPQGAGEGLLLAAAGFVGEAPCILHRADGLLGEPLLSALAPDAEPRDALLLAGNVTPQPPPAKLRLVASAQLVGADEDPALAPYEIAGACALAAGVLRGLADNGGAALELLDFAAIGNQVARAGGSGEVRVARRWRHFTGDALELLDMNRTILDALDCEAVANPEEGNRFEGKISIHPTARVSSSVIVGPVIIGAEAHISDSYIGPHTAIGERVRIEGAELERSIVLDDASVLYVGSRLVTSIVGRQARIFRDFSMPRALRLQVGEGDEVALC
jgi:glucose-1-phosphate thymidylyltransferase